MFAFTDTNFCDLMTGGETDQMDKHHAADCQDQDATSGPLSGNEVNLG